MIKIERLISDETLQPPVRGTLKAAGYDFRASREHVLLPGTQVTMPTGWAMAIPEGWVGLLKDRSGLANEFRIYTHAGVIDSDYRGDIGVIISNNGDHIYTIQKHERIAQMVIVPHLSDDLEITTAGLPETERGTGGYGHSGRH